MSNRFRSLIILAFFTCFSLTAQVNTKQMDTWQDSLLSVSKQVVKMAGDPQKIEMNTKLVKTLVSSLKERNSYLYDFDRLKNLSVLRSPDDKFRIFSWHIPLSDGSYLFYGAIQIKSVDGSLKLIPLLDKTFEIAKPDENVLQPNNWFGAQYYDIIALQGNTYVLLGWKGHTDTYTKKVIEPLKFDGSTFTLGAKIFSNEEAIVRKVFNYTRQASMYLKYHKDEKKIIYDHIIPADPSLEGNYRYYGPDLSFDAYEILQGKLIYRSNINFQNPVRGDEDLFLDPTKSNSNKSGL